MQLGLDAQTLGLGLGPETYIKTYLCGTKLPTKELMTWNSGSFAEDNKVKCMFVYALYNKPNSKMHYNNMYTS